MLQNTSGDFLMDTFFFLQLDSDEKKNLNFDISDFNKRVHTCIKNLKTFFI